MPDNQALADAFDTIAKMLDLLGEDAFKVSAHARAARLFADLPQDASLLAKDRAQLLALQGVGPKIADKVIEFFKTGTMTELDELRAKVPAGLMALLDIPGLGPKTVRAMWNDLKITDLPGLERAIADGSILTLPRMGDKAVAKIKDSIAFMKSSGERLWLGRAQALADSFLARLRADPRVARAEAAGSLRRGRDTIGDIDILAVPAPGADPAAISELFRTTPGVTQILASGAAKSSVRVALNLDLSRWKNVPDTSSPGGPSIQVDFRITPDATWGASLLYFTGSKDHNVRLRERALAKGLTLNEWGLFHDDGQPAPHTRGLAPVAAATEESIYAALGLPLIPPEAREDRGELDRPGPWRLVELPDIKAELHAHTTASDGSLSIIELATEAKRRGFHTLAVTDHSQSSTQANGLKPDRLRQHIADIHAARAAVPGITILAGSEVDILADGRLDYDDELLAQLDVVVASPHAALTQDPATATARLLKAIAHPLVHILGHPTGRLVSRRAGLSPDMPTLIAAAKEHDTALEINAHWMRLDLRDTHVRLATDAGCLIAIDCDVHAREDYDNLRFGVATARRGWLTPDRCINTWSPAKLHAWLKRA